MMTSMGGGFAVSGGDDLLRQSIAGGNAKNDELRGRSLSHCKLRDNAQRNNTHFDHSQQRNEQEISFVLRGVQTDE